MQYTKVDGTLAREFIMGEMRRNPSSAYLMVTLFLGDRWSCCNGWIAAQAEGEVVGLLSYAPQGEDYSGVPEFVGVYVRPDFRRQGVATGLLTEGLRLLSPSNGKTRLLALSAGMARVVERHPLKERIELRRAILPSIMG